MHILREYEYCFISLEDIAFEDTIIVSLGAKQFLEVNQSGITKMSNIPEQPWDYNQFIDNSYTCSVADIDEALGSWQVYFERGRRKCTDPFVLELGTRDEFVRSLYFLDYEDILNNENYIITLSGGDIDTINYKPKVDATFLFDEKIRIGSIRAGLGDQLNFIRLYKSICDESGLELWIQDLHYDSYYSFNGLESSKLCEFDVNSRRFSRIFSRKLRWVRRATEGMAAYPLSDNGKWHSLGLTEAYNVVWGYPHNFSEMKLHEKMAPSLICKTLEIFEDFFQNKIPTKIAIGCVHHPAIPNFKLLKPAHERYFSFPNILSEDTLNYATIAQCKSTYSIAIHFRRGDRIVGAYKEEWHDHIKYKESLEMVYKQMPFSQHSNKHLFVFSDDMEFIKSHAEELGFGLAGDAITYVDWNHHFNSFRDMHLMSECKVIIRSIGGFAKAAGLISQTLDYLISVDDKKVWVEWERESL